MFNLRGGSGMYIRDETFYDGYSQNYRRGLKLDDEHIERFIKGISDKKLANGTLEIYRKTLVLLKEHIREPYVITRETIKKAAEVQKSAGYGGQSINRLLTVANSYVSFFGRADLQYREYEDVSGAIQPELTRNEYLRLLSTAKIMGQERQYLLIKTVALTGVSLKDLTVLTVEKAAGGIMPDGTRIPECLNRELMTYADQQGIKTGILFRTGKGQPLSRSAITVSIQALGKYAKVDEEKCSPRCLRKLYLDTQDSIRSNFELLVEQAHERLLEKEQSLVGWG